MDGVGSTLHEREKLCVLRYERLAINNRGRDILSVGQNSRPGQAANEIVNDRQTMMGIGRSRDCGEDEKCAAQ